MLCDVKGSGAVVKHDMIAVADQGADKIADRVLCINVCFIAYCIGKIGLCAVAPNRAAVGFRCAAFFFELIRIAADRFFRNAVMLGELRNQYALLGFELVHDFVFSFDCKHFDTSECGIRNKVT